MSVNSVKNETDLRRKIQRETRGIFGGMPLRARFCVAVASRLPSFSLAGTRSALFRKGGFAVGAGVSLLGKIRLVGEGNLATRLRIGDGCIIAPDVLLALDGEITIGKNVSLGPGVMVYTATHAVGFGSRRMSPQVTPKPVVIGDGAWVGMYALVLPGVTIGQGAVVAAGSVVNADVPPNTAVGGNPAVVVQSLPFGNR